IPQSAGRRAVAGPSTAFTNGRGESDFCRMKRWNKSKDYAGENGNQQSERQHHPVDSYFVEPGNVRWHEAQYEIQRTHRGGDSRGDSVSICHTMRPRLAPSDSRTAISCCRAEARAKRRLAMFSDTMNTIRIAAPSNTSSMGRTLPTNVSCNG